jgi:hypothetical protein
MTRTGIYQDKNAFFAMPERQVDGFFLASPPHPRTVQTVFRFMFHFVFAFRVVGFSFHIVIVCLLQQWAMQSPTAFRMILSVHPSDHARLCRTEEKNGSVNVKQIVHETDYYPFITMPTLF